MSQIRKEIQSTVRATPEFKKLTESALTLDTLASDVLMLQNKLELTAKSAQQILTTLSSIDDRVLSTEKISAEVIHLPSQVKLNYFLGLSYLVSGLVHINNA